MMTADQSPFPARRLRRLRRGCVTRAALADVRLHPDDFILPLFVGEEDEPQAVESMPGVMRYPVDAATTYAAQQYDRGVRSFLIFGVVDDARKDATGSIASEPTQPAIAAMRSLREKLPDAWLMADVCCCQYTDHGHCGVLSDDPKQTMDNDATLELLGQQAIAFAHAGADVVAPSGMVDGQVAAMRAALDAAGQSHVAILSYSVKYASAFYGPFRDAAHGAPQFGDRRAYQMDPARSREWAMELEADLAEGADMVMVKPAGAYLDVIHAMRGRTAGPIAAYQVSGEYAMIHAAAQRGWLDLRAAAMESCTAIKRAGADLIISYFAPDMIDWLNDQEAGI